VKTLQDITVLDMTHAVAGPTAGMILADLGARVIKLEHPHGDHFRPLLGGAYYAALNRNKQDISLDLKRSQGKEVLRRLLGKTDLLLESFTPGTMQKLGFGYEEVARYNPELIYCSISGFGQSGPYSHLPGYDVVAQAMCGIMMCTGMPDGPPVRIGASWIDMGAGMFVVIGALKALMERGETGRGKHIDVSLMDTALLWMSPLIARFSMSGELPQRLGSALAGFSPYQVFRCRDGYVFIGASTQKFWERLCRILDLEHLLHDPRFTTNEQRIANRDELTQIIENRLSMSARDQLVDLLRDAGLPCSPVFDVGEAVGDRHVIERTTAETRRHPEFGKVTQIKTPIVENGEFPGLKSPSPFLGQHTRDILRELDYSEQEIEALVSQGIAIENESGRQA
jgi:crotonobetainyl-CoA:carnitine CoA-transferase CaiB-like acyl-CoA transferase